MKVAFFQFASSPVHFFASLEILKEEADKNNQNFYFVWGSQTNYPGRMSIGFESLFKRSPTEVRKLVTIADRNAIQENSMPFDVVWVSSVTEIFLNQLDSMKSISELKRLSHLDVNPGPALANEITNLTKNRDIDLRINHTLIRKLISSYLEVYSATKIKIEKNGINRVHVFNGRFLHERAVWDCAKNLEIETFIFETTRDRYFQRTEGFHNRTSNQKYMLGHWAASLDSEEAKFVIGSKYFSELRSKSNPFQVQQGKFVTMAKDFFVFFSSSDDEAVGFWDEWNEPLGDQIEAIKKLQEIFELQNDFNLVIRLHPNLINKSNSAVENWSVIEPINNSIVVGPSEKISSYDLLDKCVGVISYGSTLGLEAAFSLKPSLVLADSGYDQIGAVDKAKTWNEVNDWLNTGYKLDLKSLKERQRNATIRGYFLATGGIPFKNSVLRQTGWGAWTVDSFCGRRIRESKIASFYRKVINRIKFLRVNSLVNNGE